MYKLKLKENNLSNILYNQEIYWYPLKITSRNQLISINIATNESIDKVGKFWAGGRIISDFQLDYENKCLFYLGSKGNPLIAEIFGEKQLIVEDKSLNYFFSEKEIEEIYNNLKDHKNYVDISEKYDMEDFILKVLEKKLDKEWIIDFSKTKIKNKYCTDNIAPHPILHLVYFTRSNVFSKVYYKDLFQFILQKDFLVNWIDPKEIPNNSKNYVLAWCKNISKNDIKSTDDLRQTIKKIVIEIFDKYEIFGMIYLASRVGDQNSVVKILFENLHSLLPDKAKEYVEQGFYKFQPKLMVNSIELHFIQIASSEYKKRNLYESLNEIFDEVKYYDMFQHKTLSEPTDIFYALKHHETNRFRFICRIDIDPPIDYQDLSDKIYELGNAIKTIKKMKNINKLIREMWVKKINLKIFTPPHFEDDVVYSLSHKWLITRKVSDDRSTKEGKYIHIELACDYEVFNGGNFKFSFDYSRDIQYTYTILNERLALKHNFTQFSTINDSNN